MPQNPATISVTGLSSAAATYAVGYPQVFLDVHKLGPFNCGFQFEITSTGAQTFALEGTNDYLGQLSSHFNGFVSSAASWQSLSTGVASSGIGVITTPVSIVRLNVTAGSSQGVVTARLNPAG